MTIQQLQEQVSKNISHGKLTINDSLLGIKKNSGFFDQFNIDAINCTGASAGAITNSEFIVTATDVSLKFGFENNYDLGGAAITFSVDGGGNAQISFNCDLQNTDLYSVFTTYFKLNLNDYIPLLIAAEGISKPVLTISTSPASFQFTYISTAPEFFDKVYISNLSVNLEIGYTDSKYTLSTGGSFAINGQEFTATFTDSSFTAGFSDGQGFDLLQDFIPGMGFAPTFTLDDFGSIQLTLTLSSLSFTYDVATTQLTVNANISGGLGFYLEATGQADYCAAVYFTDNTILTDLSEGLSTIAGIALDNLVLTIAGTANSKVVIPNTPYVGMDEGIEMRAMITMASSGTPNALAQSLKYLDGVFGNDPINVTISYSDGDFSLTAEIDGPFQFPPAQNSACTIDEVSLTVSTAAPQIALGCGLTLDIDSGGLSQIAVNGEIGFGCQEDVTDIFFSASESTPIVAPFGITGLTVNDLGIAIEGSIIGDADPSVSVVLQGRFIVATGDGNVKGDVGVSVGLDGPVPNIPYLACSTVGSYTLGEIWSAFFPGNIALLNDITVERLAFYFCDQPGVALPDGGGTAAVGTNFLGAFIFGPEAIFASLSINTDTDAIKGNLQMSPISLNCGGVQIASLTGSGTGNPKYDIAPDGPAFSCNLDTDVADCAVSATVNADILGLTGSVDALITGGGANGSATVSVAIGWDIPLIGDTSFTFNFTSLTDMSLSYSATVNNFTYIINDVLGLGNINIGGPGDNATDLSINLEASASGGVYSAVINCQFNWFGVAVPFTADVSVDLTDLTQLMSIIENELEAQAADLFNKVMNSEAGNYIKAVFEGFIQNGENTLNTLVHYFNVAESDLGTLFSDIVGLCGDGHVDYQIDFHVDYAIPITPSRVSLDFKHIDCLDLINTDVSVSFSLPDISVPVINVSANQHLDFASTAIHVDCSDINIDIVDIPPLFVGPLELGLSLTAKFGASATIPLEGFFTNNSPTPDLDLGVNIDVIGRASVSVTFPFDWSWSDTASWSETIN